MNYEQYIDQIDLSGAIKKMVKEEGYTDEAAKEASKLYRMFLKLCKKYPGAKLIPTKPIDDVWHQHILDTVQYFRDCDAIFGEYMHHDPHFFGTPEFDSSWEETCGYYDKEFGVKLGQTGASCAGATKLALCMGGFDLPHSCGRAISALSQKSLQAGCAIGDMPHSCGRA